MDPLESQGVNTVWRWGKQKSQENLNVNIKAKPMRNGSYMIVDDKGNRDTTKASFLWLIDHGAITSADFDRFLQIKQVRNKYAHKLSEVITTGIAESEVALLFDMHSLYRKISGWFFVEIEAPIIGYDVPPDADVSNIQSGANVMFSIMLDVLYNGKSEEYQSIISSIKGGEKHEV